MASVTKSFTAALIFQAPYDLYINVQAPASSATPTVDANLLTLDSKGQPTDAGSAGFHAGASDGAAQVGLDFKVADISIDQEENAVDAGLTSVEAALQVTLKQTMDLARLLTYLGAPNLGAYNALAAQNVFQLGGKPDSSLTLFTALLIAPRRDASGKFAYFLLYRARLDGDVEWAYSRAKEALWKFKLKGFADLARVAGDEVAQFVRTK